MTCARGDHHLIEIAPVIESSVTGKCSVVAVDSHGRGQLREMLDQGFIAKLGKVYISDEGGVPRSKFDEFGKRAGCGSGARSQPVNKNWRHDRRCCQQDQEMTSPHLDFRIQVAVPGFPRPNIRTRVRTNSRRIVSLCCAPAPRGCRGCFSWPSVL